MKKPIKFERVQDGHEFVYMRSYEKYEKPLTVGELISTLEKLDPNKPVYTSYTDHTDWGYRTPLRKVEIKELNVGIERETSRFEVDDVVDGETPNIEEDDFNVDYVETDIVNIEFVEYFEEDFSHGRNDLPF